MIAAALLDIDEDLAECLRAAGFTTTQSAATALIMAAHDDGAARAHAQSFAASLQAQHGVIVLVGRDETSSLRVQALAQALAHSLAPRVRVNAVIASSTPVHTADAIAFLCANAAITGQTVRVGAPLSPV